MLNVLKRLKNQISDFFNFYFFSYSQFYSQFSNFFTLITDQKCKNISEKMRNVLKWIFEYMGFFRAIFIVWDMIDFVCYSCNAFKTQQIPKIIMLWGSVPVNPHWGLHYQATDAFELNPPSHLFSGITILNTNITILNIKSIISQKLNIA